MSKKKNNFWFFVMIALLAGTASWAMYSIINQGADDVLNILGFNNFYLKACIILVICLGLLFILGMKGRKILKKIL